MTRIRPLLTFLTLAGCQIGRNAPTPVCSFDITIVDEAGAVIDGATATLTEEDGDSDCALGCTVFDSDAVLTIQAAGFETVTRDFSLDDCDGIEVEMTATNR